jgi:hypothetical protein
MKEPSEARSISTVSPTRLAVVQRDQHLVVAVSLQFRDRRAEAVDRLASGSLLHGALYLLAALAEKVLLAQARGPAGCLGRARRFRLNPSRRLSRGGGGSAVSALSATIHGRVVAGEASVRVREVVTRAQSVAKLIGENGCAGKRE